MLVPAISYREEIRKQFHNLYYTKDMFYVTGALHQWCPEIDESPSEGRYDYAIINNSREGNLIGFLSYSIDYYSSNAYNFGLVSFDKGNPIIGRDLFNKLEELVSTLHRVEWRMIGGNPIEKHYDKFCAKHGGNKYVLKDVTKDSHGEYHDDVIYEIINPTVTSSSKVIMHW